MTFRRAAIFSLALLAGLIVFVFSAPAPVAARQEAPPPGNLSLPDELCLGCHGTPGQTYPLANGELLDLYVSPDDYANSAHGQAGYACVQCHTDVGEYPHPPFQAASLRDATLQLNQVCQRCHEHQFELERDSVHTRARNEGNPAAAVCTDCHQAHEVRRLNYPNELRLLPQARTWIPTTCARCHSEIYAKYRESVHGSALIGEGNPDVPTCIDCHGVHNIEDPTTAAFRLNSPQLCARCHTDPKIMDRYGISTNVLNTYVADFHGTTVTLFEQQTPDAETNKPVCFDCHGVHDIQRADDPQKGLAAAGNLLAKCQVCHPDATDNFPTSWLSHYIPSPEKYPVVYYVNLFYAFFIPGILGGMGLLVFLDLSRMARNRAAAKAQPALTVEVEITEPAAAETEVEPAAPVEAQAAPTPPADGPAAEAGSPEEEQRNG